MRRSGAPVPSALGVGRAIVRRSRCAGAQLSRARRCAAIRALSAVPGAEGAVGDGGGTGVARAAVRAARRRGPHPRVRSGPAAQAARGRHRTERTAMRAARRARRHAGALPRVAARRAAARHDRAVLRRRRLGRRPFDPAATVRPDLRTIPLHHPRGRADRAAGRQSPRLPDVDGADRRAGRRRRPRHHRRHDDRASRRRARPADLAAAEGRARLALDAGRARHAVVSDDAALPSARARRLGERAGSRHRRSSRPHDPAGALDPWPASRRPRCPFPGASCSTR